LIVLAIWSWGWIGWGACIPLLGALIWTYLNPSVFPEPASFDSWASLGVMGERIHIYRPGDVANHHQTPLKWLTWLPLVGLIPLALGLVRLDAALTVLGTLLMVLLKLWFVDRMVWIAREWRDAGHDWSELDQG